MSAVTREKSGVGASDRIRDYDFQGSPARPTGTGERLALAIRIRFESAAAFARASGIREGLIRQHIHRSSIPAKHLTTYVRLLRVSAEWLLDGKGIGPINDGAPVAVPVKTPESPFDPEREAIRLAIGAVDILARRRPMTADERADAIADLTPIMRDRLAGLRPR